MAEAALATPQKPVGASLTCTRCALRAVWACLAQLVADGADGPPVSMMITTEARWLQRHPVSKPRRVHPVLV